MTRGKTPTLTELPKAERFHDKRDEKYEKCRSYAVSFLDKSEIRSCVVDSEEIPKKLLKMLSDMSVGVFLNDDIRAKVFPEEIETPDQAVKYVINGAKKTQGQARNLYDFLIMSLRSQIDNTKSLDKLRKHIAERLMTHVDITITKWKDILTKDQLTPEEEEIKFRLVDKGYNFVQLILEIFEDLTKTELMNMFGFFLRRIDIKQIKPEVMKVLGVLLNNTFKSRCNELLMIIGERRSEGKHIDRQRSSTLLSTQAIQADPDEPGVAEENQYGIKPLPRSSRSPVRFEAPKASQCQIEPIPRSTAEATVQHDAHYQAYLENKAQHDAHYQAYLEHVAQSEFDEANFEDTGQVNRRNGLSSRQVNGLRALCGAAVSIMIVIAIILSLKEQKKQSQPKKGKDPIAKMNSIETTDPPVTIEKIPNEVVQADASVAPPPGPKKIIIDPLTPQPPDPVLDPILKLKKSNPNLKKIAQLSINDLPANYTDKYKSLFLGQKINLNGESMSGYIESAINEIATRSQRKKLNHFLKHKMRPGWAMYMASIDDPWFENVYSKKHKRWHKKGHRDLKKYEKLKDKFAGLKKLKKEGKELSKRQKRKFAKYKARLAEYKEQMRVGKLIMKSLGAVNSDKDVNNVNTGSFSNEKGEVAGIVVEMADAAGIEIPEIITAEKIETTKPVEPEVQLAEITPDQDPPDDDESVNDESQVDNNDHDPVQAGQDLLKKVQQIEAQHAVQAEVAGQTMTDAADGVLARLEKRKEDKSQVMEDAADGVLATLRKRRAEKSQIIEDSVDRVLDRLEISKKFRDMAKARDAEPKTDNDYYASIEIEKPSVKPPAEEDYYLSYEVEPVGKVDEPDPFDVAVADAQVPQGTDEDYYSEIKMTYEDNDYAEVEITKEDPVDNYYASVEVEESKPKGVFNKIGGWFRRKAA